MVVFAALFGRSRPKNAASQLFGDEQFKILSSSPENRAENQTTAVRMTRKLRKNTEGSGTGSGRIPIKNAYRTGEKNRARHAEVLFGRFFVRRNWLCDLHAHPPLSGETSLG
jgi:hypothetical protein